MTINISNSIYQLVINLVDKRLALLVPDKEYSLGDILGQEFWGTDKALHSALGLLFSQLVKGGSVPFVKSGAIPFGASVYRYIPE